MAGSGPLLLAVIYFVARASVHRMAAGESALDASVLTLFFLWRNWAKIRFADSLYHQLEAIGEGHKSTQSVWLSASVQGTKLIILPLSLAAILPFAWSAGFYGNMTTLATRPNLIRDSARLAGLWQRQNWFALGLVAAFAFVVFLNVGMLLVILPVLARTFSGYENEFTRNPAAMLNATFGATAAGVTWFLVSPLVQAMYVVRCFKGESVGSGADLRAALRRLVIGLAIACISVCAAHARPVNPAELDSNIRHTLQNPQYTWQNPDAAVDDAPAWTNGVLRAAKWLRHNIGIAMDWIGTKLREMLRSQRVTVGTGKAPPQSRLRWAIYGVLALIALLALLILRKAFAAARISRRAAPAAPSGALDLKGDLVASQFPEDEWLRMARAALERGDLRAALRAVYLANLAGLASAGFVAISRFKSNRDYEREVRLRSRSDEITSLLTRNRVVFESAWYGDQDKTRVDFEDMQRNLLRMRELTHA